MKKQKYVILIVILLCALTLPYVFAYLNSGNDFVFGGFLLNPLDGNSYLSKMYTGWEGEWKFHLPYSTYSGDGAYLFLFYITLGHIARIIGITPDPSFFHVVRIICVLFFWFTLFRFLKNLYQDDGLVWRSFFLCTIGSGLGWLAFVFGKITSDYWVAEGFPFLSGYANPHFPLGLSLLIWIIMLAQNMRGWQNLLLLSALCLALSIILPFGMVLVGLIFFTQTVITVLWEHRILSWPLICALFPGGLFLVYQYAAALIDPQLSIWNQQNLTLSPPIWDFVLSFSPALVFAVIGIIPFRKNYEAAYCHQIIIIWFIVALLLVYFPFNLQRRFMLGFYIPTGILAVSAIGYIQIRKEKLANILWKTILILSVPTNVLVLLMGIYGITTRDSHYYIYKDEMSGMGWIADHTPDNVLILAAPDTGLYIPAYTGRRVLYGHPFETVNAEYYKKLTLEFFADDNAAIQEKTSFLMKNSIDYVFCGPREKQIGNYCEFLDDQNEVFKNTSVKIYKVNK